MRAIVAADCESTSLAWDREAWEVALCRRDDTGTRGPDYQPPDMERVVELCRVFGRATDQGWAR